MENQAQTKDDLAEQRPFIIFLLEVKVSSPRRRKAKRLIGSEIIWVIQIEIPLSIPELKWEHMVWWPFHQLLQK